MNHLQTFDQHLNESSFDPQEIAQGILDDILQERGPEELQGMTEDVALETVEAYGYTGEEAEEITRILLNLAEGAD